MTANWVVLKFGGTSVSGRAQWEVIAELARNRSAGGQRVLLVCSAVAGVTNALTALADQPDSATMLSTVLERHQQLANELNVSDAACLAQAEESLRRCTTALSAGGGLSVRAELLAVGEWLSTQLGAAFLSQSMEVSWVDVREALEAEHEPELSEARQWLSASCQPGENPSLARQWGRHPPVLITQGFIAGGPDGRTVLLGRGGSDVSAALLAGRLGAPEVEIWTDVPGLFTADPRRVPDARLLSELDFAESLEMAASGAKVVHPRCIRAAQATGTAILVRDTARPWFGGTRISDKVSNGVGAKAITCQKEMLVLLLQNTDTRREVGFLARVFDIFRQHGLSIDLVATSETTTTVAINAPANQLDELALGALIEDLKAQCTVEPHSGCVCVNLVGRSIRTTLPKLQKTLDYFQDHPLFMLSQSANDLCLSLLVEEEGHESLIRELHAALIPGLDSEPSEVFGPRLQDLPELA